MCLAAAHVLQERREVFMQEQLEKMQANTPTIIEQFADLKRDLAQVRVISRFGRRMCVCMHGYSSMQPAVHGL